MSHGMRHPDTCRWTATTRHGVDTVDLTVKGGMSRADARFQADPYPSGFAGRRSFHIATRANSRAADWDRATACHPDLSRIPPKVRSTEGPGTKEGHNF
jgi:hypothetical protein